MIFRAQENRRRQDRAWNKYVAERNAVEEKMRQKARRESQVQQEKDEIINKRLGKLKPKSRKLGMKRKEGSLT
jgi:hypothetical protein